MPTNTYTELRREVVSVATSTVNLDLSGISGYQDLEIAINWASSNALSFLTLLFNDDTNANYSMTEVYGDGTTARSYQSSGISVNWVAAQVGGTSTLGQTFTRIKLHNYASTSFTKTYLAQTGNTNSSYPGISDVVGLWNSTSAITKVTLRNNTGGTFYNFPIGTTFSIYGIKAVGGDTAVKAIGGTVTEDSTYYYHTFKGSSTFTPLQSITADILVVAGGGGAMGAGGGGGGGGLLGFASQSLTAQAYPVIVGAGGTPGTPGTGTASNGNNSKFGSLTTALGGAYGGGFTGSAYISAGTGGGSGGGAPYNPVGSASNGTSGQGGNGSTGYQGTGGGDPRSGGGGGGAGANASNGSANLGGNGGIGATNGSTVGGSAGPYSFINAMGAASGTGQLSSSNYYYAGGGGGSGKNTGGTGGLGGGGNGGTDEPATYPTAGTAYTGGGAGSGPNATSSYGGARGGSGIVIVRYAKA